MMLINTHLKIMMRKLYREKLYTLINISGLSLGIACCVLLALYLHSELTYDQHYKKYKQIYRVVNELTLSGTTNKLAVTSPALGPALKKEFPEIKQFVRMAVITPPDAPGLPFYTGGKTHYWKNVYTVDDNFFDVFDNKIIYGDPRTALVDPNFIAVSETFAKTHFGDEYPIGKTVCTDIACVKISLVFADVPQNTHIKYDVLISYNWPTMHLDPSRLRRDLWRFQDYTYLLMPEGFHPGSFKKKFAAFYTKYMKDAGDKTDRSMRYLLEPLADIHYLSDAQYDRPHGNIYYLYGFTAIALLILLVACINYVNLATARSLKRAREVGMHKVLGARRGQLIIQYIGESILLTFIALCLGLVIVELISTLTPIGELIDNQRISDLTSHPTLLAGMLGLTLFTGVASGLYPAFYLASVPPIAALTATKKAASGQYRFRQILVFTQFVISIGVIAGVLMMAWQMEYVSERPLGFEKDNRLFIRLFGAEVLEKFQSIKNELLKQPNVLGVTLVGRIPGQFLNFNEFPVENKDGSMGKQTVNTMTVNDDDVIQVMGMKLVEGRGFNKKMLTDVGTSVIVNEAMVRKMGWDHPLGKRVRDGRVIGVVKDFNYESLRSRIAPLVLARMNLNYLATLKPEFRKRQSRMLVLDISGTNIPGTLDGIRGVMARLDPKHAFEYEFIDDTLNKLYISEHKTLVLIAIFSMVCVFISCLGLFGLSAFTIEQRTKEIGVRKVLGASSLQIIMMLSRAAIIMVLGASVFASVFSWLAVGKWLNGFAYRAAINPLVFIIATAAVIAVAFMTITLQSLKTARSNPVQALRYE